MSEFYSYLWLREDGSPYYVGKGTGNRAFYNDSYRSVRRPEDDSRIVIFPMLNEAEAFESEIALIDLFGRKDLGTGILRNRTNGGDGVSGYKASVETRLKNSEVARRTRNRKGTTTSEEGRRNMSVANKAKFTDELRAQVSAFVKLNPPRKGTSTSVEAREHLRAAQLRAIEMRPEIKVRLGQQSARGRHNRWHVSRGMVNSNCLLCQKAA